MDRGLSAFHLTSVVFISSESMSCYSEFTLQPNKRYDAKWLKTDLQQALTRDGLSELWNELVKDEEVIVCDSDGNQTCLQHSKKGLSNIFQISSGNLWYVVFMQT